MHGLIGDRFLRWFNSGFLGKRPGAADLYRPEAGPAGAGDALRAAEPGKAPAPGENPTQPARPDPDRSSGSAPG